jgi:hypothetical protein
MKRILGVLAILGAYGGVFWLVPFGVSLLPPHTSYPLEVLKIHVCIAVGMVFLGIVIGALTLANWGIEKIKESK